MKRVSDALIAALFVVLPLAGHAEGNSPVTRAQVRADLIAVEQSGAYALSKVHYPEPGSDPSLVHVASPLE